MNGDSSTTPHANGDVPAPVGASASIHDTSFSNPSLTPSELALKEKLMERMREKQASGHVSEGSSADVSHTNGNRTTTDPSTDSSQTTTTTTTTTTSTTTSTSTNPSTDAAATSTSTSTSTSSTGSGTDSVPMPTSASSTSTSDPAASSENATSAPAEGTAEEKPKRKSRWSQGPDQPAKKSRWGSETDKVAPAVALQAQQIELAVIQERLAEISRALLSPEAYLADQLARGVQRSPSPEPIYNDEGRRVNTRAKRLVEKLNNERRELIEKQIAVRTTLGLSTVGLHVPQQTFGKGHHRWEKRIPLPVDKYPDYNFQGIIIGPRGMYQKRLEKETGCLIAVRGVGCKARKDGFPMEEDTMPIHVYIRGTSDETLAAGVAAIEKLLVPMSQEERSKSLRDLAIINGTYRGDVTCRMCGEVGHIMAQCPQRTQNKTFMANVECAVCGSRTHATMDCPNKKGPDGKPIASRQQINEEYNAFMEELIGGPAATTTPGKAPLAITYQVSQPQTQPQPPQQQPNQQGPPPMHMPQQPPQQPSHFQHHHPPPPRHYPTPPPPHHQPPPAHYHQPYPHHAATPPPPHMHPPPPPHANPYAPPQHPYPHNPYPAPHAQYPPPPAQAYAPVPPAPAPAPPAPATGYPQPPPPGLGYGYGAPPPQAPAQPTPYPYGAPGMPPAGVGYGYPAPPVSYY